MKAVNRVFKQSIMETVFLVGILVAILIIPEFLSSRLYSISVIRRFETSLKALDDLFSILLFIFIPIMNFTLLTNRFKEIIQKGVTRKTFWKSALIVNIVQVIVLIMLRLIVDYFSNDYFGVNNYGLNGNYFIRIFIYTILFAGVITITNTIWLALSKYNIILPNSFIVGQGGAVGFLTGIAIYFLVQFIFKIIDFKTIVDGLNKVLFSSIQIPTVIGAILIGILSYVNYKLILQIDVR